MHRVVPILAALMLSTSSAEPSAGPWALAHIDNADNQPDARVLVLQKHPLNVSLAASAAKLRATAEESLQGTWRSEETPDELEWTVAFEPGGRLRGTLGCILFFGLFSVQGGTLSVGPLATARIDCPAGAVTAQAQRAADQLLGVVRSATGATTLALTTSSGQTIRLIRSRP